MVPLSSMCRHLCSPGIFAIVAILLLPLSRWRHCRIQAGDVVLVTMASLPSLMCRRLCHGHNGIVALIALAPLPTLHGCCCPCNAGIVVLFLVTSLPSRCMGVVSVIAPALLPPLSWRVCTIALVLLPLSRWHCYPWCAGIIALIMQASLPLLCLHRAVDSQASSLPLLSWHLQAMNKIVDHAVDNGNTSTTRATMPKHQERQHQHNEGHDGSTKRVTMPVQLTMPV
jgi:hypothetical protein